MYNFTTDVVGSMFRTNGQFFYFTKFEGGMQLPQKSHLNFMPNRVNSCIERDEIFLSRAKTVIVMYENQ